MSTFYWEYGIEAFAEVPSIQDLVVTPVMGWVYGEWAYQTEMKIRRGDGTVAGSKILGNTTLFLLDPIDSLGRGVNRVAGRKVIKAGYGYFTYTATPSGTETDHTVYLNMKVPLGGDTQNDRYKISQINIKKDPVDTGIVGLSLGSGYTSGYTVLDPDWNMEDGYYTKASMGLYFTPHLSARLVYARGDLKDRTSGESITYENYSLDAQCYLNTKGKIRPFVTAGFGEQIWDTDNDRIIFQWNGGLGLHVALHSKWALQADWVNHYSPSKKTYDQQINAGIIYRFGRGEHDDW
jgi:hypothetical protein